MKKVLVTGASGFLGGNLVQELSKAGYSVKVIVRKSAKLDTLGNTPYEVYYGNIDNEEDVNNAVAGCNIVVHTASLTQQHGVSFEMYERVNVFATKYIADACLKHNVEKLVYVSTANTIAPGQKHQPGTELNGFTLFEAGSGYINSKYLAQQYVLEQVAQKQLPAVIINPTFMIGANDSKPSSGQIILYGHNKRLLFYPPGGKNFVHIQDVCKGIINAISKGKIGDCYLLAGHNLTYKEFFSILSNTAKKKTYMIQIPGIILKVAGLAGTLTEKLTGSPRKLTRSSAYMLCLDNYYSGKKAERELDIQYQPAEVAVQHAYDWFRDNGYLKR